MNASETLENCRFFITHVISRYTVGVKKMKLLAKVLTKHKPLSSFGMRVEQK